MSTSQFVDEKFYQADKIFWKPVSAFLASRAKAFSRAQAKNFSYPTHRSLKDGKFK
jgi:hypothetical protein